MNDRASCRMFRSLKDNHKFEAILQLSGCCRGEGSGCGETVTVTEGVGAGVPEGVGEGGGGGVCEGVGVGVGG